LRCACTREKGVQEPEKDKEKERERLSRKREIDGETGLQKRKRGGRVEERGNSAIKAGS